MDIFAFEFITTQQEMSSKKALQNRILVLYIVFFAVIVASFIFGTLGSDLSKGYNDGQRIGESIAANIRDNNNRSINLFYDLPNSNPDLELDVRNLNLPEGTEIKARVNKIDLIVESDNTDRSTLGIMTSVTGSPMTLILSWILMLCYITVIVMFFLIILSLRRSIKSESVFNRKNIIRTRVIGYVLIICALLHSLIEFTAIKSANKWLEGSSIVLNTSFRIDFWDVLLGVIILFIAEIFSIGYDLSQEQRLTI